MLLHLPKQKNEIVCYYMYVDSLQPLQRNNYLSFTANKPFFEKLLYVYFIDSTCISLVDVGSMRNQKYAYLETIMADSMNSKHFTILYLM